MIAIIEEATLRNVITPQGAVDAMREAFRADGEGRAHVPAVITRLRQSSVGNLQSALSCLGSS